MDPLPDDRQTQIAVLHTVLVHAPHLLTEEELAGEVLCGATSFAERDATQRAIRDLAASGVLRRLDNGLVQVSLPARRVSGLVEGWEGMMS